MIATVGLTGVVVIDMVTFAVGVSTLLVARVPNRLFKRREETFREALVAGWRFIARRPPLIVMIAFFVPANYLFAVTLVLVTPWVLQFGTPASLGVVSTVGGLGAVIGGVAVALWGGTRRRAVGMVGFTVTAGLGALVTGVAPSVAVVAAGLFILWASVAAVDAHWLAIIQLKVGPDLQGRVLAINMMLANAMLPLGFLTAPMVGTRHLGAWLVSVGVVLAALGIGGLTYRRLRLMEDDLPDAVAGADLGDSLDEVQARADATLSQPVGRQR